MRFLLGLLLILLLFSCARHHEMEKLVVDILKSNKDNIDSTFQANRMNTLFFTDSVKNGYKPSYIYGQSDFFGKDFYVVSRGNLVRKRYYSYFGEYDTIYGKYDSIIIPIHFNKSLEHANFYFKLDDKGVWQLIYIEFANDTDIIDDTPASSLVSDPDGT